MATSNGGATTGERNLTLDDLATAHFRGILGENSISYFQEIDRLLLQQRKFQQLARDYWGARVRPTRR